MDPCMQQQYMLCLQQQQLEQQQQQRMRHRSTHSPLSQPYPTPGSPLYSPTHRSFNHHQTTKPSLPNITQQHISSPSGSPTHTPLPLSQSKLHQSPFTQPIQQQQQQQQSPLSPPVPQVHITSCGDLSAQVGACSHHD